MYSLLLPYAKTACKTLAFLFCHDLADLFNYHKSRYKSDCKVIDHD